MNCLQNTRLQQLLTSSLCAISFGMKSRYKKFTLCTKLYFYLKCLENTRLQQLLTSCCIMYNLLWKEKLAQKIHTVPKTLLSISSFVHKYPMSTSLLSLPVTKSSLAQLWFLWSWCLTSQFSALSTL